MQQILPDPGRSSRRGVVRMETDSRASPRRRRRSGSGPSVRRLGSSPAWGLVAVAVAGASPLAFRVGIRPGRRCPFTIPGPAIRSRSDRTPRTSASRSGGSGDVTFVPRVRRFDYIRNLPEFGKAEFERLPRPPGAVFFARDRRVPATAIPQDRFVWVVGPAAFGRRRAANPPAERHVHEGNEYLPGPGSFRRVGSPRRNGREMRRVALSGGTGATPA